MQVKVYLANLKLNRIYHFEKQKIIANDYLTQTMIGCTLRKAYESGKIRTEQEFKEVLHHVLSDCKEI